MQTDESNIQNNEVSRKLPVLHILQALGLIAILLALYALRNYFPLFSQNISQKIEKPVAKVSTLDSGANATNLSQNLLDLSEFQKVTLEQQEQRYAVVDDSQLVLVSLEENGEDIMTDISDISYGSGSSAYGSSDPSSAPDFKKLAYIDKDSKLHLLTADGKVDIKVSDQLAASFISGWSPDSNRLIFYTYAPTMYESVFPSYPGAEPEKQITFDRNQPESGFYLLDVEDQSVSYLGIFNGTEFGSWIDNSRVMLKLDTYGQEKFLVFDLDAYSVDAEILEGDLEKDFGTQFVFNDDGKKWALTWHGGTDTTDSASIILADFPSVKGKELMKADFAQIQGPVISPDGNQVAFRGYDIVNGPQFTYLYDGKTVERVAEGYPRGWIDNSQFIILRTDPSHATNPHMGTIVSKYDTKTKRSVNLYNFSEDK